VLIEDDALDAVKTLNLAKKAYSKMIQNLFWATAYKIVSIPSEVGVLPTRGFVLSPAICALLVSLSTVILAINGFIT